MDLDTGDRNLLCTNDEETGYDCCEETQFITGLGEGSFSSRFRNRVVDVLP